MKADHAPIIGGQTKLLGLLGKNIGYTLSPRLHNRAAVLLSIEQVYLPLPMEEHSIADFLDVFWQIGGVGLNITTPYKTIVADTLRRRGIAVTSQSVNTLYRDDKQPNYWSATSTDGVGFVQGLNHIGVDIDALSELVVIGAGGAALALVETLSNRVKALRKVTVLRRHAKNDAAFRGVLPIGRAIELVDLSVSNLTRVLNKKGPDCLLIQATNAPQNEHDLAELTPALSGFGGVVSDLVYGKPSALYFKAIALDITAQDGEAMLIEQARCSQKLWWGKSASYKELAAALRL